MSTRTPAEIRKEIDEISHKMFCEYMADFVDWHLYNTYKLKLEKLEAELKEVEIGIRY